MMFYKSVCVSALYFILSQVSCTTPLVSRFELYLNPNYQFEAPQENEVKLVLATSLQPNVANTTQTQPQTEFVKRITKTTVHYVVLTTTISDLATVQTQTSFLPLQTTLASSIHITATADSNLISPSASSTVLASNNTTNTGSTAVASRPVAEDNAAHRHPPSHLIIGPIQQDSPRKHTNTSQGTNHTLAYRNSSSPPLSIVHELYPIPSVTHNYSRPQYFGNKFPLRGIANAALKSFPDIMVMIMSIMIILVSIL